MGVVKGTAATVAALQFVASDELVRDWAEVGGAVLVEIHAMAHARGLGYFRVIDEDAQALLEGPAEAPLLSEGVVEEVLVPEIANELRGELAGETAMPGTKHSPFKRSAVISKRIAFRGAAGGQGSVMRLWVRTVAGDKARAFLADGAGVKRGNVLRSSVITCSRKSAQVYGCEAYGVFDAETGRLLAFERAEKVTVEWAARYEEVTGRDALQAKSRKQQEGK